ncbi:hypothetical protein [Phyllobacterium myrsinacearum]|nr:hypothetical protein [Phyllobacterium myrsinacearum]
MGRTTRMIELKMPGHGRDDPLEIVPRWALRAAQTANGTLDII